MMLELAVVTIPLVRKLSLTAKGMPSKGRVIPFSAISLSIASASVSALSFRAR